MSTSLETAFGSNAGSIIMWIVLALLVLGVLLVILRIIRTMRGGTFIAGGRNRAPRLAVVDAAAVDAQRRLVLVRRDNVEHLIMIGGPTDLVIEPGIRSDEPERALHERPVRTKPPAPTPKAEPVAPAVDAATRPAPVPPEAPAAPQAVHAVPRRHTVAVTPPEAEVIPEAPDPSPHTPPEPQRVEPNFVSQPAPTPAPVPANTVDVVPGDTPAKPAPAPSVESSLEEEMGRLLADISVDDARQR
jgi:hypothetical protein